MGKLTNTYKAIHKIWYKNRRNFEENFHIPHELSINFSIYVWFVYELKRAIVPKFYHMILQKLWRKFEWKASKIFHPQRISKSINNSPKNEKIQIYLNIKSSSKLINLFPNSRWKFKKWKSDFHIKQMFINLNEIEGKTIPYVLLKEEKWWWWR